MKDELQAPNCEHQQDWNTCIKCRPNIASPQDWRSRLPSIIMRNWPADDEGLDDAPLVEALEHFIEDLLAEFTIAQSIDSMGYKEQELQAQKAAILKIIEVSKKTAEHHLLLERVNGYNAALTDLATRIKEGI